jgi:hypothetical protein
MAWPWVLWLGVAGFGVTLLAGGIVKVFCQRVFLVDLGEPLWLRAPLAQGGAENVFVICDAAAQAGLDQCPTIQLAPFASRPDSEPAWAQLRRDLDRRSKAGGALVVDDFEDGLDDGDAMLTKLRLLEELVADPDWTVIVVSALTPRALSEAFRQVRALPARRRGGPVPTAGGPGPVERWSALMAGLTLVDRRAVPEAAALEASWPRSSRALLDAERASHPYVARVCDDLVRAAGGDPSLLTREQLLDEIGERTARFYRRLWTSCTDDEKVVLGHIADHGFANIHVRRVVRRLLGRGLLRKDPALRPMSESFRQFVRSAECSTEVTRLETQAGRSAWDRLRWPLALGVVGAGLFLFVTQKELYNAIFGVTTAAGVSIPALIRAVGMLAGRRELEGERA